VTASTVPKYTGIVIVVNVRYPLATDIATTEAGERQHSNSISEADFFIDERMCYVDNLSQISAPRGDAMDARDDGEVSKLSLADSPRGQAAASISSLNEAWHHALDKCAVDTPLSETIFPLMRNCFFGGALHAVLLLQKGHGDQLASDIAGFLIEEPRS
jgi:hypothetical protein